MTQKMYLLYLSVWIKYQQSLVSIYQPTTIYYYCMLTGTITADCQEISAFTVFYSNIAPFFQVLTFSLRALV